MARVKLTANNHCHKPVAGGAPVEEAITQAASSQVQWDAWLEQGGNPYVRTKNGHNVWHALARGKSGTATDRRAAARLAALVPPPNPLELGGPLKRTPLAAIAGTGSFWLVEVLASIGALEADPEGLAAVLKAAPSRGAESSAELQRAIAHHQAQTLERVVAPVSSGRLRPGFRL